jgi:hypothetical protein
MNVTGNACSSIVRLTPKPPALIPGLDIDATGVVLGALVALGLNQQINRCKKHTVARLFRYSTRRRNAKELGDFIRLESTHNSDVTARRAQVEPDHRITTARTTANIGDESAISGPYRYPQVLTGFPQVK